MIDNFIFDDIEYMHVGSHFLSSGGGEVSAYTKLILLEQIKKKHKVRLIESNQLNSEDLIAVFCCLGSPDFEAEKLYNTSHFIALLNKITDYCQKPIKAISILGCGGGTPFLALYLSLFFDIPIMDGDFCGRTFSELQQCTPCLYNISPKKAFLANQKNGIFEFSYNHYDELEKFARQIALFSGGSCTTVPFVLSGTEVKRTIIDGTLTKAITIGKIIREKNGIKDLIQYTNGSLRGEGAIIDIKHLQHDPYFKMKIEIFNLKTQKHWQVFMANEYELLLENNQTIAEIPDIITLCKPDTCEPIIYNRLQKGMNVSIFTMKSADVWYTKEGQSHIQTKNYLSSKRELCA